MENNKLTWVELKKIVARQTNLTEKEVNLILNTWLNQMTEVLKRGEDLHINGLGTFRLKTMKPRKSVNVTTGEAIVLPETKRLTYTMASGMEDTINNASAPRLQSGIDPIQKLSNQADEIVDILGEIGQAPQKTPVEAEPVVEPVKQEQKPIVTTTTIPDYQIPVNKVQKEEHKQPKERLWLTALITIIVFILLLFGLVFFFQNRIEKWLNDLRIEAEMEDEIPNDLTDLPAIRIDTPDEDTLSEVPVEEIQPEEVSQEEVQSQKEEKPQEIQPEYTEFITVEEMHQDSRLAWMAYRYYGKKDLWVFIYDANRDHLSNPEIIPVGTKIRIPKLDSETQALATPELQEKVRRMADEFLHK
ncbi:MAG: HU family DNA-binding protein [Paludibacteraceae bacterium]|nr:HU family DNA-binding protein [Paludibacteraceae bacterium]